MIIEIVAAPVVAVRANHKHAFQVKDVRWVGRVFSVRMLCTKCGADEWHTKTDQSTRVVD